MKPDINRVVRYVIGLDGWGKPVVRPAMIVQTWEGTIVNLQVFTDGENDVRHHPDAARGLLWRGSVAEDPTGQQVNTWHWPPMVPKAAAPVVEKTGGVKECG